MRFTIIDIEVFEAILEEINDLSEKIHILYQNSVNKESKEWLVNEDVCHILKISKSTLQNYRDTGRLPFSRISGVFYYKPEDIKQLLINSENKRAWK
jgi:hypothetical protein